MRDGIVATTDPNDPSFLKDSRGKVLEEKPISGEGGTSKFMHASLKMRSRSQAMDHPSDGLDIVRQASIDEVAIEMMVRPKDLAKELQNHELHEIEREYEVDTADIPCFHCEGTGLRHVAVKNVYGKKAGAEAKSNWESRQHQMRGNQVLISRNQVAPLAMLASVPGVLSASPVRDDASFFQDVQVPVAKAEEITGTRSAINGNVPVGSKTSNDTLNRNMLRVASTSTEEDKTHPSLDRCWVCRGTGKAANAMLQSVMDRAKLNPNRGETKAVASNEEVDVRADTVEEDDELCAICWCDPPKYGISTSCTHFFCVECIQGHLKQVQQSGEFPGFCPMCQASAPKDEDPVYGRIDGKAMTFLERHDVIDKEFQFRFMRKQNEDEQLFFECPAKCGNYLVGSTSTR